MKLKDIKVGQVVVDKFGNEYIVNTITENKLMPIGLKCIKFIKNISVQDMGKIEFHKVGQSFYIYKSKKRALKHGDYSDCITVKSLKLKSDVK